MRLGWFLAVFVLAFALVIFVVNRPTHPLTPSIPQPTWGSLTLKKVALREAAAAGDAKVQTARWVFTHRFKAIPYLTPGQSSTDGTAEYLVTMAGHFNAPAGAPLLPGSVPDGTELTLLVRAVDGAVRGVLINDRSYSDLRQLGIVYGLRFGFHPFGL